MNYYFITGTSSGIGKALVEQLILDKKNYIFGYSRRNFTKSEQFQHKIIDLSDVENLKSFSFPELSNANKIVLINNAGTLGEVKHLGHLSADDIVTSLNVNITSVLLLINAFIKQYQNQNAERLIINISSGAAHSAYDGWGPYCTTKAGINMITEVVYKEQKLENNPIKIFAIAPGVVDTYMQDTIRNTKAEDFSNIEKFHILKDQGALYKAKDVAHKLISLCENPKNIPNLISRIEL